MIGFGFRTVVSDKAVDVDCEGYLGPTSRSRYAAQGVKHLPKDLAGFDAFWEKRRARMRQELERLLVP
jgi:hypothetical protein